MNTTILERDMCEYTLTKGIASRNNNMTNEACLVFIKTAIQVERDRFPDSQSRPHEHASEK